MPQTKPMRILQTVQEESHEWRQKNFPDTSSEMHMALGVAEEAGELCHAVLKHSQGIRGMDDEIKLNMMIADAAGDIVIFLCGLMSARGLDLETAVWEAWQEVKKRNPENYPAGSPQMEARRGESDIIGETGDARDEVL